MKLLIHILHLVFSKIAVDDIVWVSYYIPKLYMDLITCP